ncbi:hypothetical protein QFZ79_001034 [Arthrobacter sp. V4I6]|nr:hypothetical protein [Arthrobacter sp. V1I7]MDQ0852923.1 hypothetical protein [Arthrobacter sp. V4I6]
MVILFAGDLRPVPHQETGVAGEFVLGLRDDLHDQFLRYNFAARDHGVVQRIGVIQFTSDAAGVRGVLGSERF